MSHIKLSSTGKILIVGSKPSNFEGWLKNKPEIAKRLEFWQSMSSDGKVSERESIPKFVEVIILTRFISHSEFQKIGNLARKAGVNFQRIVCNTGEIKRVPEETFVKITKTEKQSLTDLPESKIDQIIEVESTMELNKGTEPEESNTSNAKRKGFLIKFILVNADLKVHSAKEEINRLWLLASAQNITNSKSSVMQTFYTLRRLDKVTRPWEASSGQKEKRKPGASSEVITQAKNVDTLKEDITKIFDQFTFATEELSKIVLQALGESRHSKSETKICPVQEITPVAHKHRLGKKSNRSEYV